MMQRSLERSSLLTARSSRLAIVRAAADSGCIAERIKSRSFYMLPENV